MVAVPAIATPSTFTVAPTGTTTGEVNGIAAGTALQANVPSEDVKVKVEWNDIQSVLKAAGVLNLPEIAFVGRDGVCYISAVDSANPTADNHEIEIGTTEDTFQLVIKTENLKLLPQDYEVTLSSKGISKFAGNGIKYFIAIESKSTYKKGN
jgi:hypothetical protein